MKIKILVHYFSLLDVKDYITVIAQSIALKVRHIIGVFVMSSIGLYVKN